MVGEENVHPRYAPWFQIPERRIVAVEHPGIVKNVDRAIKTLQGDAGISKVSYQLIFQRVVTNFDIDTGLIQTKQQSSTMPTPRGSHGKYHGLI